MVAGSEANQLGSSFVVREWDRAVGLRLENAVVLAAHCLDTFNDQTDVLKDTLACAMTGEPVPAEKARRALSGKIKELVEEGSPMSAVKSAAKFLPNFYNQTQHKDFIELLSVGRDWDELRREFVPCLSFANASGSFNPDAYAIGSESMYSQSVLDMLFEEDMSLEEATDLALRAIYFAAFTQEVKAQAVEAVDVCVVTADNITRVRHDVKDLHATYGPLIEQRKQELLRNPVPSYWYTVSELEDEDED